MIIVLTTYPDSKSAMKAAELLVEKNLAKCVNVMALESSIYKWKGKLKKGKEFLLIIKAADSFYPKIELAIKTDHPYELPEVIELPVTGGLKSYLDWVDGRGECASG